MKMELKNITAEGWLELALFCIALGGIILTYFVIG